MKRKSTVIIDDEFVAAENIALLLETYCPEIEVVGIATSIAEGIKKIKALTPDLVFLDISMPPEGTGFDLLTVFPDRNFSVIFVTAYEEYAIQAIKARAFDYILKPVDYKELMRSVANLKMSKSHERSNLKETIVLPTEEGTHIIKVEEILYCKASGSYTTFYLENGTSILLSKPLKYVEEALKNEVFERVHRSFIINLNRVTKVFKQDGGYVEIDKAMIPLSKGYGKSILSLFQS